MSFTDYQVLWNSILTLFLFISGGILLIISYKGYKVKNFYGGNSTLLSAIILILFGCLNSFRGLFLWPYSGFFIWWATGLSIFYLIFALFVKQKEIKLIKRRTIPDTTIDEQFSDTNFYQKEISIKNELYRKSFHLAGLLIIASFYGIGFGAITNIVNNAVIEYISSEPGTTAYELIWGPISLYPYVVNDPQAIADLTFFALWGTFAFISFPEYIRVLIGAKYSLYNRVTKSVLRGKEYKSAGPQIFLVLGATTSFFFAQMGWIPYQASIASSLTACFSDALAAVIGRKYGKHKVTVFRRNTKSLEGFLVGVGSAYLICLIFLGPIYALVAAFIFFLLDYFTISIADNLLNPILISLGLLIANILIGIPMGW
jgi:dolichol kinase